jgi:poly(hydroxyalkanoate) granule-associated protein
MADNVKEQAQQIWLAGLGAFSKAQQEGTKAFEKLVSDGITMQRKAQVTAEEKLAEATEKVTQVAHQFNQRATGQWDKLETIFEDRVAKALTRLGIPSPSELQALHARIESLEQQVAGKAQAKPKSNPKATTKASAKTAKANTAKAKTAPAKKAASQKTASKRPSAQKKAAN